ncbi:putative AdoMet-dependent methyltransferase [Paenibacillus sp. DS2015]|uniref:class I SAM-dependent DNA methyltransferase n=1 Tax=Paenibacillus sp. DS2015 TaxID=3373917 RepID=UPI003D22CB9B
MGREFIDLFDEWSENYNQTVSGDDPEYREVFEHYEHILAEVASLSAGVVIEFGVGTGNLTQQLLQRGLQVYGIEPSEGMRVQMEKRDLPCVLLNGDFLDFPTIEDNIDTIVSTYAFHHLTDIEKEQAISIYNNLLGESGKIVFADTLFIDEQARKDTEDHVRLLGHSHLLKDLQTEYYTTRGVLRDIFIRHGFSVTFKQLNRYVWLIEASRAQKNNPNINMSTNE